MALAIQVEDLSKQYFLKQKPSHYATLRDSLAEGFHRLCAPLFSRKGVLEQRSEKEGVDYIWALQGLSFSIQKGESVAIIGRNGAGKSTLLKVLSRITEPTRGRARVYGRMASLLEVGTGFHPELTGRENIFLNGAILGMHRWEIRKKFDQIVSFAEVEKFVDVPVKRYSSGMYVRLAFSVAAHLDPDILLVDEVLSVGDAAFQKKCMGIMQESTQKSRTVIFVTHNLPTVRNLCKRTMLVKNGKITADGPTEQVLNQYLKELQQPRDFSNDNLGDRARRSIGGVRFESIRALDQNNKECWQYQVGEAIRFVIQYKVLSDVPGLGLSFNLVSPLTGEIITNIKRTLVDHPLHLGATGQVELLLKNPALQAGDFGIYMSIGDQQVDKIYDITDQNVDLPLLSITSPEQDPHKRGGYFIMPAEICVKQIGL